MWFYNHLCAGGKNQTQTSGFKEADSLSAGQILNADFPLEQEVYQRHLCISKPMKYIKYSTSVSIC